MSRAPFRIEGEARYGGFVVLCDHAASAIPPGLDCLGLAPEVLETHVALDRGALALSQALARALDAPLAYPTVSRLLIDCNRAPQRADLVVDETEFGPVPGNLNLSSAERSRRIVDVHAPYHEAVANLISSRTAVGEGPALVAVHSFTPVLGGRVRPWHVGVLYRKDEELAEEVAGRLRAEPGLSVGLNVPYAPADGVYYTLERHAEARGLPSLMLEVRNDLIGETAGIATIAARLAGAISASTSRARPAACAGAF